MQCHNCNSEDMYSTLTYKIDGNKYKVYECNSCDDLRFKEIKSKKIKTKEKVKESLIDHIALGLTSLFILLATLYVCLNIDKFITTN